MSNPIAVSQTIQDQARSMAKSVLSATHSFRNLPLAEQRAMYLDEVRRNERELMRAEGMSVPAVSRGMIDDFEDYDPGFDNSVDAFEDLVDSVDFPKFVADLMKAVFDANMEVMKSQTDDYIRLMREATKTTADFITSVADEDAFAYLVESSGSQFGMTMKEGADGSSELTLTSPEGEPVDMDDNEVKAKIVQAKIDIAKEHRAALREVLLMGVTRLVVDKGEVEAGVEFKINAKRDSRTSRSNTNTNVNTISARYGGGLGGLFGGPRGSFQNVNTNINVRTGSQTAQDDLTAKLMGKVNIKFKTDYFELDNFANMYADGGVAALQPQQAPALPDGQR